MELSGRGEERVAQQKGGAEVDDTVQLAPGQKTQIALTVWAVSNGERGGLKSFSHQWHKLDIA